MQFHLKTNNTAAIVLILGKQSHNLSFQAFHSIAKTCLQASTRHKHHVATVDIRNNLNAHLHASKYEQSMPKTPWNATVKQLQDQQRTKVMHQELPL